MAGEPLLELARMQADARHVHHATNRLLRLDEPAPDGPAPRFFVVRAVAGNLWRTRYDLAAGLSARLERPTAGEPIAGGAGAAGSAASDG